MDDARAEPNHLLRILGSGFGIATVVGGVIGVGILRVPAELAAQIDDPLLFLGIWVAGAIAALLGANCVAELATMLPRAGGPYVYVRRAFGAYPGFLMGWVDWFVSVGSAAFVLIALAEYGVLLAPGFPGGARGIAVAAMLAVFTFHALGLRTSSRAQDLLSAAKALAFLGVVAICLLAPAGGAEPVVERLAPSAPLGWAALFLVARTTLMVTQTYAGWHLPVYMAEENVRPERSLPRALFIGIALVAAIYLLINIALLARLSLPEIAASPLPIADAAARAMGSAGGTAITAIAVISLLGLLSAILFQSPRILFALARDGWFLGSATRVSRGGAPVPGLAISAAMVLVLALTGTFGELFVSIGLIGLSLDAAVYLSLLRLRVSEPDAPRPFRAIGYPLLPLLAVMVPLAVVVGTAAGDPASLLRGAVVLALSLPLFWLLRRRAKNALSYTA